MKTVRNLFGAFLALTVLALPTFAGDGWTYDYEKGIRWKWVERDTTPVSFREGVDAPKPRGASIDEATKVYQDALASFNKQRAELLMKELDLLNKNAQLGVSESELKLHAELLKIDFNNLTTRTIRLRR